MTSKDSNHDLNDVQDNKEATSSPLQEGWERLQKEFNRSDGDVRLLTIAVLSGVLSIVLLLPLILS